MEHVPTSPGTVRLWLRPRVTDVVLQGHSELSPSDVVQYVVQPLIDLKRVFFSEREPMSSSVRPSVVCLSVTLVRLTQAIEFFGNVSTPFGTLAIC